MKILYLHQYFSTPLGHGGTRSYEFSKRWVAMGHTVRVITGKSFDPSLQPNSAQKIDGVEVTTVNTEYSGKMSYVNRIWSFFKYVIQTSILILRDSNYDVIIATSSPLTICIPALLGKFIHKKPYIFEVRDVWPDAAIDAGILKNCFIIRLSKILESLAYKYAQSIVSLSDGMCDRIRNKGVCKSKLHIIPNCCDFEIFSPIKGRSSEIKFKPRNCFVVLYCGSINHANNIEYLVDVMSILKHNGQIQFVIIGNGNKLDYLKSEIIDRNIKNVTIKGYVSKSKLSEYFHDSDCGLVTFLCSKVFYENSPNKFFDYSAAGLPTIFNRSTWLQPYLQKYNIDYIADCSDPRSMANIIISMANNKEELPLISSKVIQLAKEEFDRDVMASKFLNILINSGNG